jgi:hypothetical protein
MRDVETINYFSTGGDKPSIAMQIPNNQAESGASQSSSTALFYLGKKLQRA